MKICINIGHGGKGSNYDTGAIGADSTEEHKFNRDEFYPFLIKELKAKGFIVETIIQEKNFSELPARINSINPDLILSIHSNCANGKASGTEVLYWKTSKKSKNLAQSIQNALVRVLKLPDRGIQPLGYTDRGNALVRLTNAPCVILEPFFIDNPKDLATARQNLQGMARGIADSVKDWVSGNH